MAIATLGQYVYATSQGAVYLNQFVESTATVSPGGASIGVTQKTRYPWDGKVTVLVEPASSHWQGTIYLRIPASLSLSAGSTDHGAQQGVSSGPFVSTAESSVRLI